MPKMKDQIKSITKEYNKYSKSQPKKIVTSSLLDKMKLARIDKNLVLTLKCTILAKMSFRSYSKK